MVQTVEAATHTHTDDCYAGTKHSHTGSNTAGTGCYEGGKTSTSSETNGYFRFSYWQTTRNGNYTSTGPFYDVPDGEEYFYESHDYVGVAFCDNCGAETTFGYATYSSYTYNGSTTIIEDTRDENEYSLQYQTPSCYVCDDETTIYALNCNKNETDYYDVNGTLIGPSCDKIVVSLSAKEPDQDLEMGETPTVTATATFLDGHTEEVECQYQTK